MQRPQVDLINNYDYIPINLSTSKFPWLLDIEETKRKRTIEKILSLGKTVFDTINLEVNPISHPYQNGVDNINNNVNILAREVSSLSSRFNIVEHVDELLMQLSGNIKSSAVKGKIGENFIENTLTNNFPDDDVIVKAREGHESDIHFIGTDTYATTLNTNHEENKNKIFERLKILIESKLYSVPVNSRQIEKFYADLDRTGMNFGIFISLTSGISNRKRLEYENYNGKHILFLPNAGFEGLNIVYSVLFFKTLFKYLNTETNPNKNIITVNEFNNCLQKIRDIMSECYEFWEDTSRLRYDIGQTKIQISGIIESLYKQALETEIKGKNILKRIENEIEIQFKNLCVNNTINSIIDKNIDNENFKKLSKDYKTEYLEELRINKDKTMEVCFELFNFVKENKKRFCLKHFVDKKQEWYLISINNKKMDKNDKMDKTEKVEKLEGVIKKTKTKFDFESDKFGIKINLKNSSSIETLKKFLI